MIKDDSGMCSFSGCDLRGRKNTKSPFWIELIVVKAKLPSHSDAVPYSKRTDEGANFNRFTFDLRQNIISTPDYLLTKFNSSCFNRKITKTKVEL